MPMSPTDFQARSSEEGRDAQVMARRVLEGTGFQVESRNTRIVDAGVMVNFVLLDRKGRRWYCDTSGCFTSERAGLLRTDTLWKTLGRTSVLTLKNYAPLLILTTNLPLPGSSGDIALRVASRTYFDAVEMMSNDGKKRLRVYAQGNLLEHPLPGFLTLRDIYRDVSEALFPGGPVLSVPVAEVDKALRPSYRVAALPHRLTIYVPSVRRDGRPIQQRNLQAAVTELVRKVDEFSGGCTMQNGIGAWTDPLSGAVYENVTLIDSYCQRPFTDDMVSSVVEKILRDLDQSAAAVVIDQTMYQFSR